MTRVMAPAPEGQIYVCPVCGRTSPTRAPGAQSDEGWDTSCAVNAILCEAKQPAEGVWNAVKESG